MMSAIDNAMSVAPLSGPTWAAARPRARCPATSRCCSRTAGKKPVASVGLVSGRGAGGVGGGAARRVPALLRLGLGRDGAGVWLRADDPVLDDAGGVSGLGPVAAAGGGSGLTAGGASGVGPAATASDAVTPTARSTAASHALHAIL